MKYDIILHEKKVIKMTVISKEKVKDMYYANLMYEYHRVTEKIRLFEKKIRSVI